MPSAWFSSVHIFVDSRARGNRQPADRYSRSHHRRWPGLAVVTSLLLVPLLASTFFAPSASAAQTVQLGAAAPFAVLAGTAVTDVPTSSITGDVGLSPASGTNYAGLTQAQVTGTIYSTDGTGPTGTVNDPALLTTAQNDLTTAYVAAAGQPPTTTFVTTDNQLGGQTLTPGVYAFGHAATANITASSPLVLNGQGNTDAVFVFQASSDLVTASNSVVQLENGAQACNVFWQVGSSATLNSGSTFVGTIMALTSATLDSGATVQGRVLARNGAVTLDANTITTPSTCAASSSTTTTTSTPTTPTASTGTGSGSTAATGSPTTGAGANGTNAAGSTGVGSGATSVPLGFPHTGYGGAAHARDRNLIAFGGLAIAGSIGAFIVALRRRPGLRRRGAPGAVS